MHYVPHLELNLIEEDAVTALTVKLLITINIQAINIAVVQLIVFFILFSGGAYPHSNIHTSCFLS